MLASDTPTNDQNTVPFITPSPAVGESHAPKAPLKKVCLLHLDTTISNSQHTRETKKQFQWWGIKIADSILGLKKLFQRKMI